MATFHKIAVYPPAHATEIELAEAAVRIYTELATYETLAESELVDRIGPLQHKQVAWKEQGWPAEDAVRLSWLLEEVARRRQRRETWS